MPDTIYIVDVFSLMFQVFHAIPSMTSPQGLPTNAVFGFTRDLLAILRDKQPTHLICALDSSGPGQREQVYAEYKANREEMPDDLRPQIPMIGQVMQGLRIPAIECQGWEADDVVATITRKAVDAGFQVRIVTNDKDVRQLLGPQVQIYNVRKGTFIDEAYLAEDWGVRPDQVVDFQSLVGDSVDNVPGVPLVGPKKARALLEQFDTLDNVLAHADEAPGKKLRENLVKYAEQARTSRELVQLNQNLDLEVDWDEYRVEPPDAARLLELFTEFGFRRLADEMRSAVLEQEPQHVRNVQPQLIASSEALHQLANRLRRRPGFAIKLLTRGPHPMQAEITGMAISDQAGDAFQMRIAEGGADAQSLPVSEVLAALEPVLANPEIALVCDNAKHVWLQFARRGLRIGRLGLDPVIGDYLLDAGGRERSIDKLVERYLSERLAHTVAQPAKVQRTMFDDEEAPSEDEAAPQAARDVEALWRVAARIQDRLQAENLWELYDELERPLIPILAEMERTGIRVDVDELQRQGRELRQRLDALIREIHELAGHEFNIDSPRQLSTVLFEELGLPVQKKTKTGASTNQDVLEKLAELHPLPARIIEHRQCAKLCGTYLDALPRLVNPETGRIHATFHQVVAATGRLSSSDPNLQNIPIRTPEGREVRRAFIPEDPSWRLLCADYSQIELRMLAHFSGDPELQETFQQGGDIHTAVAAEVYGVEESAVQPEMRRVAKAVNFGVIYGQTAWGLAQALGISKSDAARFIDDYFARFAKVAEFTERVLDECAASGYAHTILGRRRPISGIRTRRPRQRNLPERTAINMVIQGSAADLIKRAMVDVDRRLRECQHPARLLLQIHDELVFEVPETEVDSLVPLVREAMEQALPLSVPVLADLAAGPNWLDLTPISRPD